MERAFGFRVDRSWAGSAMLVGTAMLVGRAVLIGTAILLAAGCGHSDRQGCKKDTDCKASRICVKGSCRNPNKDVSGTGRAQMAVPLQRGTAQKRPAAGSGHPSTTHSGLTPRGIPIPSTGSVGGRPGTANRLSMKICVHGRCTTVGPGSSPMDIMGVLNLLMGMSGGLYGPGSTPKDLSVKVCSKGKCVLLDKNLGSRPQDMFQIFDLLTNLLGSGGLGGFALPSMNRVPRSRPPAVQDPPNKVTFTSIGQIRQAGSQSLGKVAELTSLTVGSVTPSKLVLQGGNLLVILDVPNTSLIKGLDTRTSTLTARFYVTAVVTGNLVRGRLISAR